MPVQGNFHISKQELIRDFVLIYLEAHSECKTCRIYVLPAMVARSDEADWLQRIGQECRAFRAALNTRHQLADVA